VGEKGDFNIVFNTSNLTRLTRGGKPMGVADDLAIKGAALPTK